MAKNQGQINFGVNFNVNTASIDKVRKTLQDLRKMSAEQIKNAGGTILPMSDMFMKSGKNDLGAMRKEIDALGKAFEDAYNPKLGTYELSKFNQSLKESGTSAERAFQAVSGYGQAGKAALLDMTTNMLAVDRAAKQVSTTFEKLGQTMMNTIRWSVTSTAINTVTGAIQQAYHYAVDLDKSLNDIMIVTDKSAGDMEEFARQANKAAKALGASTKDYTQASLIYYQQGLSDRDVAARTETTLKAAAITGQSAEQVSEQLTAVWNGYKVSAQESELYIDKLSAVAATTAADLEELSVGMSKVASAANIMGVDVDQLNAQLATIVSVTREAPESIGTALKTVYARMSDIEAGLDTETTLGEYTAQMMQMGISVLDANGKLRDMGEVVEEIGNKWTTLNREQQVSLAQSIAGTRQYSRMMALFDNWDMYQEAMTTSIESAGELSRQHVEYLASIEAHQEKLTASAEGLYDSIFDSDEIKGVYDLLSGIVTLVDELVQAMGGMPGILATVGLLFAKSAKHSIADLISKREANKLNNEIYKKQIQNGKEFIEAQSAQIQNGKGLEEHLRKVLDFEKQIYDSADNLTDDQWKELQAGVNAYNESVQETIRLQIELEQAQKDYEGAFKSQTGVTGNIDKNGVFSRKTMTIGGKDYWLANDQDSEKEGKLGLISAKQRKLKLEEVKIQRDLNDAEQQEYDTLKYYIPLAEKENKIRQRHEEATKNNTKAIENSTKATEEAGQALSNYLEKVQQSNKITNIIENFSTISFSAVGASANIQNFAETVRSTESTFTDWVGVIGGAAMAFAPLISMMVKASKTAKATGATFSAAFGPVGWIMLGVTALSMITTAFGEFEKAQIDAANKSIEASKKFQEETKTILDTSNSFLRLYEEYQKTGEASEQLKTSAQEVAKALENEGMAADATAGRYDKLAESIREANKEKYEQLAQSATEEKSAAETKLSKVRVGNVAGAQKSSDYGYGGASEIYAGLGDDDGDADNIEILKNIFEGDALLKGAENNKVYFKDIGAMSAEEKARFYTKLSKATGTKGWISDSKSEINKEVRKILDDEQLMEAVQNYKDANKSLTSAAAAETISKTDYEGMSTSAFTQHREQLIEETMSLDDSLTRDQAAARVDAQIKEVGGTQATALLERAQWVQSWTGEDGISESFANEITERLSLEDVDTATFNALKLVDLETFEGTADELIDVAKEKAKELQDAAWAAAAEARFEAVENNIDRLERMSERLSGEEKVNNLKKQNELLEKQEKIISKTLDIQRKELQDKTGAFFDLVNNDSIDIIEGQEDAPALQALLAAGEYEVIQDYLGEMEQQDEANALQEALTDIINSSNALADSETQLLDIEDQRLEKYLEMQEANWEIYNDQREQLEENISLLEKQMELQELLTKQSTLSDYSNILAMRQQLLASYQEEYDKNQEELKNNARWLYDQYGIEYVRNLEERQRELATAIADGTVAVIEAAREEYVQTIKEFSQNIVDNLFGEKLFNLDLLNDERDWTAKQSERYYDQIDAAYELTNLEYEYNKAINNAGSLKTQEKLTELKEQQLKALREMDELSESDVKRSMKLLELEQARLALQEAQSNKNTMRLVRGADGTYGYQYVADESKIAEAEQSVARLENELVNLDEEAWKESLDTFYDDFTEFIDKLVAYAEDGTIDEMESSNLKKMYEVLGLDAENAEDMQEYFKATLNALGLPITDIAQAFGVSTKLIEALNNFSNSKDFASFMNNYSGTISGAKDKYQGVVNNPTSNGSTSASQLVEGVVNTQSNYNAFDPNKEGAYVKGHLTQLPDTHGLEHQTAIAIGAHDGGMALEQKNGQIVATELGTGLPLLDNNDNIQWLTVADNYLYKNANGTLYAKVHPIDNSEWIRWVPLDSLRNPDTQNQLDPRQSFDTGGYTGNWNSADGRLATVHEKELILNKEDTSNFLDALSILRSLNLSMLNNLSQMSGGYGNALSAYEFLREMLIEQNVYINAEFPNASDANEIREAFNELMNLATQHIYTNNRG